MHKLQLIVAVKEASYITRLADYIQSVAFGKQWQLTAFTQVSALRQFMKAGYPVDLLAAQPAILEELDNTVPAQLPIVALLAPGARTAMERGWIEVQQFQPLPQLLHELAAAFTANADGGGLAAYRSKGKAQVIGVYSAAGGIGKSALALQLARQAGWMERRVFYLNLERWNASALWCGEGGGEDFSQLLYTIQAHPDKAAKMLAKLRRRHTELKLDYIAPCRNTEERLAMTGSDARQLVAAIAQSGLYDLVIVDMDCGTDDVHEAVLAAADQILWLLSRDSVTLLKTALAMDSWEKKQGEAFKEQWRKFRFIAMFTANVDGMKLGGKSIRIDGAIPFVAELADGRGEQGEGGLAAYKGLLNGLLCRLTGREKEGMTVAGEACAAAQGEHSRAAGFR
ncbi:hypothetical protein [Paenibacillus sp. GCM10027626]|uniref:hypothetical protein n=1 Tax=Paenibacillus sp. GCM10027626 TaxID=3273411 RepID=UPI00363D9C3E